MKSKNIPPDISRKSIKEAQEEINDIITKLEDTGVNLEDSMQHYNRMIQLNNHIQDQFKKKANQIKKTLSKDSK
jgi:exodeoxyribonuclease VII small subunit|tara:strand:+ start:299 stop:520 length:222 start_codon:yes stop_codon:yes gene_type:complete